MTRPVTALRLRSKPDPEPNTYRISAAPATIAQAAMISFAAIVRSRGTTRIAMPATSPAIPHRSGMTRSLPLPASFRIPFRIRPIAMKSTSRAKNHSSMRKTGTGKRGR